MLAEDTVILLESPAATNRLANILKSLVRPNDVLALTGPLGAGKTHLTQALFKALGVKGHISSPTFTLVNEHKGRFALVHMDLYRLARPEDIEDLGYEEYLDCGCVIVIEWADRAPDYLPAEHISIDLQHIKGKPDARLLTIGARNPRSYTIAREVKALWQS